MWIISVDGDSYHGRFCKRTVLVLDVPTAVRICLPRRYDGLFQRCGVAMTKRGKCANNGGGGIGATVGFDGLVWGLTYRKFIAQLRQTKTF